MLYGCGPLKIVKKIIDINLLIGIINRMGNVYQLKPNPDVFRFELYNLNYFNDVSPEIISGHYTFWFHLPSRKFVFCKHGDYANLVSIRPVNESPRHPSAQEFAFLDTLVTKIIRHTCFYDGSYPNGDGRYLLPSLEKACDKRDGHGTEWFKHADGHYGHIMKTSRVFEDHTWEGEPWDTQREKDKQAIQLLTT